MRERITFVHGINNEFDPKQLQLDNDTLHINALKAAREDRITLGLYELPQEVSLLLSKPTCGTIAEIETAMASFKTDPRDTLAMGLTKAVYVDCTVHLQSVSRLARLLHSTDESLGVCEHCFLVIYKAAILKI